MKQPATRIEIQDFLRRQPLFPGKARNRLLDHSRYDGVEEQKVCGVEILVYEEAMRIWTFDLHRLLGGHSMEDVGSTPGFYTKKAISDMLESVNLKLAYPETFAILKRLERKYG